MIRPVLRRQLTLEAPVAAPDGGGGHVTGWEALGALWADLQPVSGGEELAGARATSRVSHRILVRGAPVGAPARPRPDQRFRDGTRVYAILAVAEYDPQGRYLTCWASEGDGA